LAGFFQNGLLGLLDNQSLKTGIVDKRPPPGWVAILQKQNKTRLKQERISARIYFYKIIQHLLL